MSTNIKFYKIKLIVNLLNQCATARQQLLDELIIYATDDILLKRRVRMLSQLAQYESQLLKKIYKVDTDNIDELNFSWQIIKIEIDNVCNRSA